MKQLGVHVKKLYKLEVEDCDALSTKVEKVKGRDVGEVWHKILGHLHHDTSNIIQQITTSLPKGALK